VDLDLIAPSLFSFFKSSHYLNDFLYGNADVRDCIVKVSDNLYVIPASPDPQDIKKELRKSDKEEMKTLERLMVLKRNLDFDYVILDTHPGLSYSSINSLILSDVVFLVLRPDKIDVDGTKSMLKITENLPKPVYGVVNRDYGKSVELGIDIVARIPCSCDVTMDSPFFVKDFEDHEVTQSIKELAAFVLGL
jgi:chromosome partitioning protein